MELIFIGHKYKKAREILVNMLKKEKFNFCEKNKKTDYSDEIFTINIYNENETSTIGKKIIVANKPYFSFSDINILKDLKENDYIIINNEAAFHTAWLCEPKPLVLTYGLNHKCSITASSVQEDIVNTEMQICIQRKFNNIIGKEILPGEFTVHMPDAIDLDVFISLVALTIVLGQDVNKLKEYDDTLIIQY